MTRDRGKQPERVRHDESTVMKVYLGLAEAGIQGQQAIDAVSQMLKQGILFRERGEDLKTDRFADIPDQAERVYSTSVPMRTPDMPLQFVHIEYSPDGLRAWYDGEDGTSRQDVTEEYLAWQATLPITHSVGFEWVEDPNGS